MENLGIATPRVRLLASLPNVGPFITKANFDSSAHNWSTIQNSPFFSPLLVEALIDPSGTFAALMPSKRIFWVKNFLQDAGPDSALELADPTEPLIAWKQLDSTGGDGTVMEKIIPDGFDSYTPIPPADYLSSALETYKGPIWIDNAINRENVPNDLKTIEDFLDWVTGATDGSEPEPPTDVPPTDSLEIVDVAIVYQSEVRDGLWWGMESTAFLEENMPFWVNLYMMRPPTTADKDTVFVISLGQSDPDQRFDIYLSMNNKPRIVDWVGGTDTGIPQIQKEFETETSRLWSSDTVHRIGIMTIAGRLVVLVDGEPLIYTRIDKSSGDDGGTLLECKIAAGPIKIFGTNAQMAFNVSPMAFAPYGAIAIPVPVVAEETEPGTTVPSFQGVNWDGEPFESVCHLPTPPSVSEQRYGCDCSNFSGDGGSASPSGFGFHKKGDIGFYKADAAVFSALPSTKFYVMDFRPENLTMGGGYIVPYGGTPYYFRLKGINISEGDDPGEGESVEITDNVISIDETATAPDYFHCKKSLDVVCYDGGGALSSLLVSNQSGVEVHWGWDGDNSKTFTGVVTSVSTSQKAGMETVTIRAEDYFHILKNTPIINSPFYDGMVAYYAVKDLAERGSLLGFTNEWEDTNEYFLPAGYSFSKPQVRYNGSQSLFDCMMDIVKRFEAFLHFDENGRLVISKLPGGLFSMGASGITSGTFVSDPTASIESVILDEKQIDVSFESTVNVISAMTLERDTRNPIIYVRTADGDENKLLYKKVFLYNQAALGELEVCRDHVERAAERMFAPILKTRWKTVGTSVSLTPLSFVNVDDKVFRLMSLKRSYNAEQNDMTTSYEAEWKGG